MPARQKNFAEADRIRDELAALGVVLKDSKDGNHLGDRPMMARAHPSFALRPFLIEDTPLLTEIFRASIEELAAEDYSEGARQAWASAADDEEAFARRLGEQLTLIATMNGSPVGFASLANNETIDMLYVHPAVAGQGAGTMLVDALEKAQPRAEPSA